MQPLAPTLNRSDGPNGSNADRSDGFPLNTAAVVEAKGSPPMGTEKAAKGSMLEEVLPKGSERCLSSLFPSSPPSSRWELVLNPLMLLTGLLEPA